MFLSAAKLRKLRNRSLHELYVRGRQETAKLAERLPRVSRGEMSDRNWLGELRPELRSRSVGTVASLILDRIGTSKNFFPFLDHRSEIVELMTSRFPSERLGLIARADRLCSGRFDLLGFTDLSFGDPIDWRLEPVSGKRTPMAHWSLVDALHPEVTGDRKVTWELNRHQFFVTLGQAYWLTGDRRYVTAFTQLVSSPER